MENGHTLFDYNININDVIQLMIKPVLSEISSNVQAKTPSGKRDGEQADKENTKVVLKILYEWNVLLLVCLIFHICKLSGFILLLLAGK